ncbi:MAG TPA: histidine kinase dimerization/phospho-acceptor domain-containing protein [Gemmatimonadales bacterium]|nr:histidine kinase dimerization/phospho-acceptor domain-containing protein [Gemmatimonadales bacterium]
MKRTDSLAAISHALRNDLNTVLTAAALLQRDLPPESGDRRHVELIRRSAEHMNRLIGDLLDAGKK